MTKRFLHLIAVIAACLALNNCAQKQTIDIDAEKEKVKLVVDDFKIFWETKDMSLLSKIMANDTDMVNYGTDASEIFVGFKAFKDAITPMLSSVDGIKIDVKNQTINVDADGNTAWFSEVWDWDISLGGQTMQQHNLRLTGVLEKRDGNWVIVQFHNSVPSIPQ